MTKKKNNIKKEIISYQDLKDKVAVVWTRVSTKEQAENNHSLDVQKKECKSYAEKHGIKIVKHYGGTHESAKNEGRLYRQMITEVSKNKDVNMILVYSFDHFSRAGEEGIITKKYLKTKGIYVVSVTQQTDPDSAAGEFMENMLFLFNQFENNLRKGKCEAGMKECLERGYWFSRPPMGFDKEKKGDEHIITVNNTGKLIRKAFKWKATEELTNEEIVKRLKMFDLHISKQKLSEIFRNPFYCGKIKHGLLDYKVIEGKQEVLIDEATFNKVNGLCRDVDYVHADETPDTPLKKHLFCSCCGELMSGYTKLKKNGKQYHYYKCSKKGCCCNINAEKVHESYTEFVCNYTIPESIIPFLKLVLTKVFYERNQGQKELHKSYSKQLTECENKIKLTNVKYGLGEINSEVYEATISVLKENKYRIEIELEKAKENLSNLEKFIEKALLIASKLGELWRISDFKIRQRMQNLMFPEGVFFNKQEGIFRTHQENKALVLFRNISDSYNSENKKENQHFADSLCLVAETGFEPMTSRL